MRSETAGVARVANQDSFIDEVNEDLRRDRLYGAFRRYGWIGVAVIVIAVGGASWKEWQKAEARAAAEARGDAILAVSELDDPAERASAFAALGEDAASAALTGLLAAGEEAAAGDTAAARARLDAIASDPAVEQVYRDLATLKSVMLPGDEISAEDRLARLQPLTLPGSPFRLPALEQVAIAHVAAGDEAAAIEVLTGLLGEAGTSQGLRRRAAQLIVVLGGSLDAT
jgi:hypothetical protein